MADPDDYCECALSLLARVLSNGHGPGRGLGLALELSAASLVRSFEGLKIWRSREIPSARRVQLVKLVWAIVRWVGRAYWATREALRFH